MPYIDTEERREKHLADRAKQKAYDIAYESREAIDKLMAEWHSSYTEELKDKLQAAIADLQEALEVL